MLTRTKMLLTLTFTAALFNATAFAKGQTVLLRQKSLPVKDKKIPMQRPLGKFESWALNSSMAANIKLDQAASSERKEVIVAVIDTGIDPNHPYLKGNIYRPDGAPGNFGVSFTRSDRKFMPVDRHGHGTHVSGIIKSVHANTKILALKYYDPKASGQQSLDATIAALEYAVDQNVDIINYSGGGPESSKRELEILKRAERKGILVIAAAGNERSNIDKSRNAYYPASYGLSNIISVSAVDHKIRKVPSSNWGANTVDLYAPGYSIKSALPNARAGVMTGTSQATAFVSGVASLIKSQYPNLSYKQIKAAIVKGTTKFPHLASSSKSGGILNASLAVKTALTLRGALTAKKSTKSKPARKLATR